MSDPKLIAENYIALWNDNDDTARHDRLAQDWSKDAVYTDPLMAGTGHDGIAQMIAGARAQFPGHSFSLIGTPEGHNWFVRFSWMLAPEGGKPTACGTDVVRLDDEGRITEVIGFLDGGAA